MIIMNIIILYDDEMINHDQINLQLVDYNDYIMIIYLFSFPVDGLSIRWFS